MVLIVGLGNPGKEYAKHRHNIGFMVLDSFARQHHLPFDLKQSKARVAKGEVQGKGVILAKPQTYMNASGVSVQGLVHRYNLFPADALVVCDDLDLPLGKTRLRPRGSSGGHKGLQSIIETLNSQEFLRLRIGIGRPPPSIAENAAIDFVLTEFTAEEVEIIKGVISRACDALLFFLEESIQAAMNKFNRL